MSDDFIQPQNLISTIADAENKAFKDGYYEGYREGMQEMRRYSKKRIKEVFQDPNKKRIKEACLIVLQAYKDLYEKIVDHLDK